MTSQLRSIQNIYAQMGSKTKVSWWSGYSAFDKLLVGNDDCAAILGLLSVVDPHSAFYHDKAQIVLSTQPAHSWQRVWALAHLSSLSMDKVAATSLEELETFQSGLCDEKVGVFVPSFIWTLSDPSEFNAALETFKQQSLMADIGLISKLLSAAISKAKPVHLDSLLALFTRLTEKCTLQFNAWKACPLEAKVTDKTLPAEYQFCFSSLSDYFKQLLLLILFLSGAVSDLVCKLSRVDVRELVEQVILCNSWVYFAVFEYETSSIGFQDKSLKNLVDRVMGSPGYNPQRFLGMLLNHDISTRIDMTRTIFYFKIVIKALPHLKMDSITSSLETAKRYWIVDGNSEWLQRSSLQDFAHSVTISIMETCRDTLVPSSPLVKDYINHLIANTPDKVDAELFTTCLEKVLDVLCLAHPLLTSVNAEDAFIKETKRHNLAKDLLTQLISKSDDSSNSVFLYALIGMIPHVHLGLLQWLLDQIESVITRKLTTVDHKQVVKRLRDVVLDESKMDYSRRLVAVRWLLSLTSVSMHPKL